jgi:D-alanyl-lipoteichoic acid acyltransferase DltB (MBOAT superfamily)
MLFHSWLFLLFFLIVYPTYLLLIRTRFRIPWLLLISAVFYGWWNPVYLLLLFWTATVDYLCVLGMSRTPQKRPWLWLSIINDLGLLGFFKYGKFVTDNINAVCGWLKLPFTVPDPDVGFLSAAINSLLKSLGLHCAVPAFNYLLPIGISFYIFQSLTYTIDFYRGRVDREPSFMRYLAFVSLFPPLLSGPIERASNILPQLREASVITRQDVADGLSLFVVGLFKKVALADYLALYVDPIYSTPGQHQATALALATAAFGWQLYFDFSGYTDMARGIARLFGIKLMLNFNNPYLATGLGDFWRRWHISLSSWFKDYVYISLGGNRRGEFRTYMNMCITMLVSGLWHGATWNFVIWGAIHALGRVITRAFENTAFYKTRVPTPVKQLFTFLVVTFAWIFFRARTLPDAWLIIRRIFAGTLGNPAIPLMMVLFVLAVWAYQYFFESRARALLRLAPVRIGTVILMIVYMAMFVTSGNREFIYFQF